MARHNWFEKEHVVPAVADANYEKMLLKLATKGIVKLFNAVQTQQKTRMEEKGSDPVAPKPDKLTKGQFLDLLKGGHKQEAASENKKSPAHHDTVQPNSVSHGFRRNKFTSFDAQHAGPHGRRTLACCTRSSRTRC